MTHLQSDIEEVTNIVHIGDIHIKLTRDHSEYLEVFNKLYRAIDITPKSTVIVVAGDTFHTKLDLSPECIQVASNFLQNLANRRPTILIAGNHDLLVSNKSRLDSLTPIVDSLKNPNLFYLKETGLYKLGNILFNNFSIFDEKTPEKYITYDKIPKIYKNEVKHTVALFHGPVNGAITDVGYLVVNKHIVPKIFDGHDIVLLGDIHKHQSLQTRGPELPEIVFCGSTIQQNHGEDIRGHGFVYWNLCNYQYVLVEIPNDFGYYTIDISHGKLITDISKLPKKVKLRIRCTESIPSEVKEVLDVIRAKSQIIESVYVRIESEKGPSAQNIISNINLTDIGNVEYQNVLLREYLKNHAKITDQHILDAVCKLNEDTNSSLSINQKSKNIRWKAKTLWFDNMCSYGENNVVNFENMSDIIGLFSANKTGKSSIGAILSFCIFDTCDKSFRASYILNDQKTSFKCKFNFELDDVDYFIEREGVSDKKGNVKVGVKFWKIVDSKIIELHGEARRSTNDIIRDYVGSYDDFVLTTLSIQNDKRKSFIDLGQTERKDLLSQFMGLTIFDELYNSAVKKLSESAVLLKNYGKTEYSSVLTALLNDIEIESKQLAATSLDVSVLETKKSELTARLLEESTKLQTVSINNIELDDLLNAQRIHNTNINLNSELILKHKQSIKILTDDISPLITRRDVLKQKNISENKRVYDSLSSQSKKLWVEFSQINNTIKVKTDKLLTLEKHKYDPNCVYCINNVFVTDAIATKASLETDRIHLSNLEKSIQLKDEELKSYGWVESDICELNSLESKISALQMKISGITNDLLKVENSQERELNKLKSVESNISAYYSQQNIIETNKKLNQSISDIQSKLKRLESSIFEKNKNISDLTVSVSTLQLKRDKVKEDMIKIKTLESTHLIYQQYTNAISTDGIPFELILKMIPKIEKTVNDILNQITDFTVSFVSDGKNVDTYINYNDRKWPLELASGMEKFTSSLAIRIALLNISNLPRPNFMILDEGFSVLDSSNIQTMSTLFAFLKNTFDFVIIISHLDAMRDFVDSHLEITKENGFSKVKYL